MTIKSIKMKNKSSSILFSNKIVYRECYIYIPSFNLVDVCRYMT